MQRYPEKEYKKLIMKLVKPILKKVTLAIPCANTVQGLTPAPDAISTASPRLTITSIKTDSNDGYIVRGLGELQKSVGTNLILRNCTVFSYNHKNL